MTFFCLPPQGPTWFHDLSLTSTYTRRITTVTANVPTQPFHSYSKTLHHNYFPYSYFSKNKLTTYKLPILARDSPNLTPNDIWTMSINNRTIQLEWHLWDKPFTLTDFQIIFPMTEQTGKSNGCLISLYNWDLFNVLGIKAIIKKTIFIALVFI